MDIQLTLEQKQGLGASALHTVKNLGITYSQPSECVVVLYPESTLWGLCSNTIHIHWKKSLRISTLTRCQPVLFSGPLYHMPKFMGYKKSSSKREVHSKKEKGGVPGQSSG